MRIADLTRLSWDQVRRRKVVTMLCAAGLSIGCAAIILAMSIGESTQEIVSSQLNSFLKMDEITVYPNNGPSSPPGSTESKDDEAAKRGALNDQKLEIMRNIKHVKAVAPFQEFNYMEMTTMDSKKGYALIVGTDLSTLKDFGESFMQGDVTGTTDTMNAVVLSYGATLDLLDPETRSKLYQSMDRNPYDENIRKQYESLRTTPTALFKQQIQILSMQDSGKQLTSPGLRVIGVLKKRRARAT